MTPITITHFTDPGCPFAWSAEPARWRLQWLYGDGLEWRLRMVGNLAPELARREDPETVAEVLEWAGEPLATAEVAAVSGVELGEAREQLGRVADEEHVGSDGLWALEPVAV